MYELNLLTCHFLLHVTNKITNKMRFHNIYTISDSSCLANSHKCLMTVTYTNVHKCKCFFFSFTLPHSKFLFIPTVHSRSKSCSCLCVFKRLWAGLAFTLKPPSQLFWQFDHWHCFNLAAMSKYMLHTYSTCKTIKQLDLINHYVTITEKYFWGFLKIKMSDRIIGFIAFPHQMGTVTCWCCTSYTK